MVIRKNREFMAYMALGGATSLSTWVLLFLSKFLADRGWSLQSAGGAISH